MLFHQIPKAASAGTNYIDLTIPLGAILKKANATNSTKHWQLITIQISDQIQGRGRGLSLLHAIPQPGNKDVSWEGEMLIEQPFIYVTARFSGCDANDALTLTVGYEVPAPRKGWWL